MRRKSRARRIRIKNETQSIWRVAKKQRQQRQSWSWKKTERGRIENCEARPIQVTAGYAVWQRHSSRRWWMSQISAHARSPYKAPLEPANPRRDTDTAVFQLSAVFSLALEHYFSFLGCSGAPRHKLLSWVSLTPSRKSLQSTKLATSLLCIEALVCNIMYESSFSASALQLSSPLILQLLLLLLLFLLLLLVWIQASIYMCWVENQCRTLRQQIPVFTAVSSRERHVCSSQQRRLWPLCVIINSFQQVLPFDSLTESTLHPLLLLLLCLRILCHLLSVLNY